MEPKNVGVFYNMTALWPFMGPCNRNRDTKALPISKISGNLKLF